jgi:segregation and condensation protein A
MQAAAQNYEEKLYGVIISKEFTWESLIRDIVTSEGMDPWNIDVAKLADMYLRAIKEFKQMDIKVSGKFILAAAILLKMKSDYLFPRAAGEIPVEEQTLPVMEMFDFEIEPRLPVPKQRKITIEELVNSLRSALVVKERRTIRHQERDIDIKVEIKKFDLAEKIKSLYGKITGFFKKLKVTEILFSSLIPSKNRWDMIWTFIPLIHLADKGIVGLRQEELFGEIYVSKREQESTD